MSVEHEAVGKVLSRCGGDPHALVQILRETQELAGWLFRAVLGIRGARTDIEPGPGRRCGRLLSRLPYAAGGAIKHTRPEMAEQSGHEVASVAVGSSATAKGLMHG